MPETAESIVAYYSSEALEYIQMTGNSSKICRKSQM